MRVNYTPDTIHEAWTTMFTRHLRDEIDTAVLNDHPIHIRTSQLGKQAPELLDTLRHDPETCHEQAINALHDYCTAHWPDLEADTDAYNAPWPLIQEDIHDPLPVTKIRAAYDKQLVRVTGMLATAGPVQRHPLNQVSCCKRCGRTVEVSQPILRFRVEEPYACDRCEKKGIWEDAGESHLIDYQVCRLTPRVGDGGLGMVDSLNLILTGPLAGAASPGEDVTIHGYTVLVKDGNVYDPVLVATHVDRHRAQDRAEATEDDLEQWQELVDAHEGDVPDLVADALMPRHHGDQAAKRTMAMACFSSKKPQRHGRDCIHALLMGDPSTGKSELLRAIAHALPKAIHVNAKQATRAGLTATVARDKEFGGHRLEPGALVLANGGACCIDEIDKAPDGELTALHEAMAQLTVSISMAGNTATLPANASVLAAANPVNMRWDPNAPVSEQLDLPPTILSRFDAIHLFVDRPDEDRDRKIANMVLDEAPDQDTVIPQDLAARVAWTLADQLDVELPAAVRSYLKERFVAIRKRHGRGVVPITQRQLAAMKRFTRAHARMYLRDRASRLDAEWAADHVEDWVSRIARDSLNQVDIDFVEAPGAASQRDRVRMVHAAIKDGAHRFGEILEATGLDRVAVERTLETLSRNGEVYEAEHGDYRAV